MKLIWSIVGIKGFIIGSGGIAGFKGGIMKNSFGCPNVGSLGCVYYATSGSTFFGWALGAALALTGSSPSVGNNSSVLTILPFGTKEAAVVLKAVALESSFFV